LGFTYTSQTILENGVSNPSMSLGIGPTAIVLNANVKLILVRGYWLYFVFDESYNIT
jgi:hypothetical protein